MYYSSKQSTVHLCYIFYKVFVKIINPTVHMNVNIKELEGYQLNQLVMI